MNKKKKIKLNLIGLRCPLPVLRIAKKLKEIDDDIVLEVETDDPESRNDIKELCKKLNVKIVKLINLNKIVFFALKKS